MNAPVHPAIMVMGVSGCGKSTVGAVLAERLGARFVEGDDHHPPANREAMARGTPLTEEMRRPWLESLGTAVARARLSGPVVFSCSGLKRAHRDVLRERAGPLDIVHLTAPRALLFERMAGRSDHFMPVALLDSQLATLEPPGPEEAVILDAAPAPETLASAAEAALKDR